MNVLGIESSCDETAAAIVIDGVTLKSNVVATQIEIHKEYGGVVPEIAARSHIEVITKVIEQALSEAEMTWDDIDLIGVTEGAGLSGSLLIGTLAARTLAITKDIPLVGCNHVLGHVYANFIDNAQELKFPLLSLIVSGGHTQLVLFTDYFEYKLLGKTLDDAVGEAFDKVAKVLGLPYPGGPSVQAAALSGDPEKYKLPSPKIDGRPYDFSFSGLKTAVLRLTQSIAEVDYSYPSYKLQELLKSHQINDIAASFQKTAVDILVSRVRMAEQEYKPATIVLAGGVAASKALRQEFAKSEAAIVSIPEFNLCTDNAAMIASLAYFMHKAGKTSNPLELEIQPNLVM